MKPAPTRSLSAPWTPPSGRVLELLRQGAEVALHAPAEWLDEVDLAGMTIEGIRFLAEDPVLMASARRINRGCIHHWAENNLRHPGEPVSPFVSADMLTHARELVRRGATDLVFTASRATHQTAWQLWMKIAFGLTINPTELQELLDVSARSIAHFIDGTMNRLAVFIQSEREELSRGTHVDRREIVSRIMDGASVNRLQASQRLGYNLDQHHHAAVIWSEEPESVLTHLEQAAQSLIDAAASRQSLSVLANAATLWVWTTHYQTLDLQPLEACIAKLPGVRVAVGSAERGIEGFRRAHLDALSAQRVMGRLRSTARVVHFDMVRLVSLMTHDAEAAQQFISHTLGDLATAEPVLQRTLLAFLRCGCNATEAAEQLATHRNTLLRRLAKAEELLPKPLDGHRVHVAAALEALNWANTSD